jgi:SAM-dependent methyltransferase
VAADGHLEGLYADIERYYTHKVTTHGATPLGVDWPCIPTQELRFVQLLRVCSFETPFSLNDIGCGYGAVLRLLTKRHRRLQIDYVGVDLSPAMVQEARRLWHKRVNTEFIVGNASPRSADYSIASGIFNVKLNQPEAAWLEFIKITLTAMHATSRLGFAVNFLAPLDEGLIARPELYRAPPALWMQYCERALNAQVEILGNYGMREYTLLIRRA